MKNLQRVRTRRQLLRVTAVGAASFRSPFLALSIKSASAQQRLCLQRQTTTSSVAAANRLLLFEGYKDFNSFGQSSGAGTANRR